MNNPITDERFIDAWKRLKSPRAVANELNLPEREVYKRRRRIESRFGLTLAANEKGIYVPENLRRLEMNVENGHVVVFSDAHYWPEDPSPAHNALVQVIKELKPKMTIANGDVMDGARISRHEPLGWQALPTVREEIDVCTDRMDEIKSATPKGSKRVWTMGNHDIRFDRLLAANVSAMEGIAGMRLSDHFPDWQFGMSIHINGDTVVKHRYHNGIHATYNNTMKSGVNMVTGHLHRLQVTAWGDYNGRRYGVDTGTLAEPQGDQFSYMEDNPSPWASGFAVLTFERGRLLPPELCEVVDGVAYFRGKRV